MYKKNKVGSILISPFFNLNVVEEDGMSDPDHWTNTTVISQDALPDVSFLRDSSASAHECLIANLSSEQQRFE